MSLYTRKTLSLKERQYTWQTGMDVRRWLSKIKDIDDTELKYNLISNFIRDFERVSPNKSILSDLIDIIIRIGDISYEEGSNERRRIIDYLKRVIDETRTDISNIITEERRDRQIQIV